MIYSVSHTTTFRYDPAVREAVMEVRLHPRSESDQRCLSFMLEIDPVASVLQYRDFAGNEVHHFDIAATHAQLKITAKSQVEVQTVPPPRESDAGDWADLDALVASGDYWEMLLPSHFVRSTSALESLSKELLESIAGSAAERHTSPFLLLTSSTKPSTNSLPMCRTAPRWIRPSTRPSAPARACARTLPTL